MTRTRDISRWLLAFFYAAAGVVHLVSPRLFVSITPDWIPQPELIVTLTGVAELAGVVGLLQNRSPALRRAAGWGLAAYALCVWPANFNHMAIDLANSDGGFGLGYHVPRLMAQPLVIWLALWVSEATEWPFARKA